MLPERKGGNGLKSEKGISSGLEDAKTSYSGWDKITGKDLIPKFTN